MIKPRRFGLRARIAAVIGGTWCVAVLAVVVYLYGFLERRSIEEWQTERMLQAEAMAAALDHMVAEAIHDLQKVAGFEQFDALPAVQEIEPTLNGIPDGLDMAKRRVLDAFIADGRFSVMFVLLPDGRHYLSHPYRVQQRLKRFDLSDRPYFIEATRTRAPVVSNAFVGADGVPAVAIDVPTLNAKGEIAFHIGGVLHLDRLATLFAASAPAASDVAMLADGNGMVMASHLSKTGAAAAQQISGTLVRFVGGGQPPGRAETQVVSAPDGGELLVVLVRLQSGWGMAMARSRAGFIDRIKPQLTRSSLVVGGILACLSMIGFVIALRIAGHWEHARDALEIAHEGLEERVRLRTAELDRSRLDVVEKSRSLETILANVSQGISLYDGDMRLVLCNARFAQILDLPPEMCRPGTAFEDLARFNAERGEYGPGDPAALTMASVERTRSLVHHRFERVRPNGTVVEVIGVPLPGGGFVSTHDDVTAKRQAEDRLRTLSLAVEQSPVSVVITDPHGAIQYVNRKFIEVTGYSAEEALGRNPRILKSGLTSGELYHNLWRTITAGGTWEGDLQNRKKSGELFWEHVSVSPIRGPDHTVISYVAVKEDVSSRKLAEANLVVAVTAAQEANRSKTVFLSHMSHELRTPLTAIIGYAEMMSLELAGPLSIVYRDYVESVMSSGRHLLSIIDELLDITRIEMGSYKLTTTEICVAQLVRNCCNMVVPQCHAKGIDLHFDSAPAVPAITDGRALRQVVINVLANAVKYTPGGGRIRVSVTREGGTAVICVADTGKGIPADQLSTIFEPFQRVDPRRADPSRGVGLGLAISRRIITLLNGTIHIESRLGAGTSATITVAAMEPRSAEEHPASTEFSVQS